MRVLFFLTQLETICNAVLNEVIIIKDNVEHRYVLLDIQKNRISKALARVTNIKDFSNLIYDKNTVIKLYCHRVLSVNTARFCVI